MAESQVVCLDEDHVNEKVPETRPEFYYSEEQRAAIEQLVRNGDGAFKMRLKEDNVKDFLSAQEVQSLRNTFDAYTSDSDSESEGEKSKASSADSGVHSTYWPEMSDTEIPPLDAGWVPGNGVYRGASRVVMYSHPPKENGPHIKQVVRKLIQESHKVVAIVMDRLTDLQILQDLLDALSRRGVAVYAVLEAAGVPHFLDMCGRLQINAAQIRNLRVRSVKGAGLALSVGKLPGSLSSKYMLVDGEKVMFGSYSFTWSSSRLDRNTITVMTGHVVDFFDNDFREMYAASEEVDLFKEFSITRPPATPLLKPVVKAKAPALSVSISRFQVSLKEQSQNNVKVPAHKYHNPKYSLVVGNSLSRTCSLQDVSSPPSPPPVSAQNGFLNKLRHAIGDSTEKVNGGPPQLSPPAPKPPSPPRPGSEEEGDGKGGSKKTLAPGAKKPLHSFRGFLKGRGINQISEDLDEGVVTPPPTPTPSPAPAPVSRSPAAASPAAASPAARPSAVARETEDSFDPLEKPPVVKIKSKKPSKLPQRSMSLMTLNTAEDDPDGYKGRKRSQKKNCIQS
ncbi:protein FAM83F [Gadus macrocephalus]|uniref:protein FAM83F n=1 Tax=Gadus macrocephalus TaxID=80720 RepID=UPI0028CB327F|nr:protein FAM83F [Gadus macrocephalus]